MVLLWNILHPHAYQLDTLSVKEITKFLYLLENLQILYVHISKPQEAMTEWEQTEEKLKYN
jgi:uncharacterized protein YhhL (DUF1145 family)